MFPERRPRGNQLRNAKLNPEKVILIRDYRRRGITYKRIAKELKISASLVYVVASGKGWKHVVD
jgi:DNA invertase Pin-like site-specific DNA recombinase